ncbi:hypothetical protein KCP75_08795 [Salmonella enterica subsp. enterica]|nr:hypothetical protein KCP75_08795 [Salmonella enterica subsp. enterica]
MRIFGGNTATAISSAGGATGEHLVALLADENVPVSTVDAKDWIMSEPARPRRVQRRTVSFCYARRHADDDEFRQLEEQVPEIESGVLLVISGSLPPGVMSRNSRN